MSKPGYDQTSSFGFAATRIVYEELLCEQDTPLVREAFDLVPQITPNARKALLLRRIVTKHVPDHVLVRRLLDAVDWDALWQGFEDDV